MALLIAGIATVFAASIILAVTIGATWLKQHRDQWNTGA
jgi:hypothetical protein